MKRIYFATLLCFSIGISWAVDTALDEDGMLLANGERRFVIGLYQNAETSEFAGEAAGAGFNLIRSNADIAELDRAEAAGLMCWIPVGNWAVESDDLKESLKAVIDKYKSHPALAVWEGPDEILWNVWWLRWNRALDRWREVNNALKAFEGSEKDRDTLNEWKSMWERYRAGGRYAQAEAIEEKIRSLLGMNPAEETLSEWSVHLPRLFDQVREGSKIVRANDADHVIWFNHAPRNTLRDLRQFEPVADIIGCDIYPIPFGPMVGHSDLRDKTMSCVGAYTRRMAESAPGKPVWMVLQGFGWDDLSEDKPAETRPRPTFAQTRFMAYDAIVNKARGILYWGTFVLESEATLWKSIKQVVSELNGLQRFLSAKDANQAVTITELPRYGSAEKGVVLLAKQSNGDWSFFVVNEADEPIAFEIGRLDSLNGRTVEILNETETLTVEQGRISYGLPGQSVAVLLVR